MFGGVLLLLALCGLSWITEEWCVGCETEFTLLLLLVLFATDDTAACGDGVGLLFKLAGVVGVCAPLLAPTGAAERAQEAAAAAAAAVEAFAIELR